MVPDLQVALINFSKFNFPAKRFLQGAGVGHSKQNVPFGHIDKPLKNFFWAVDVFQHMQAKNDIKTRRRKGIRGNFRPDKIHGVSLIFRKLNALGIHVGSPHAPSVFRKEGQRFPAAAAPVEQCAGGMDMVPKQVPSTYFPILLVKVVTIGFGINPIRQMGNHK